MKKHHLAVTVAASVMLAACSTIKPESNATYHAGPDYTSRGSVSGVQAFVYGDRTLLRYDNTPFFLWITDSQGRSLSYEHEGGFYRLERLVPDFTARADLFKATTFHLTAPKRSAPVAVPAAKPHAPKVVPAAPVSVYKAPSEGVPAKLLSVDDKALHDLLDVSQQQQKDIRAIVERQAGDLATLEQFHNRLDKVQAGLVQRSSALLMVYYPRFETDFALPPKQTSLLLAAAANAAKVNIRGRTDSDVAGSLDGRIALARAAAARTYLISHGVAADKIEISSLPAGDFVAPNSGEGRDLNRRVEIEIISARIPHVATLMNHREGITP